MSRPSETKPSDKEVQTFVAALLAAAAWCTARELAYLGNTRRLRALREHCEGAVISGQRGYLHVAHATVDDVEHFQNRMRSQAAKMTHAAHEVNQHPTVQAIFAEAFKKEDAAQMPLC